MAVDKKYKGIKKVAGITQSHCRQDGYGMYIEIAYDPSDDTCWCEIFCNTNSWSEYHDENIVVTGTTRPKTMKEIKLMIEEEITAKENGGCWEY